MTQTDFLARHRETLDQALEAIRTRKYYSAYPEIPSGRFYGETAKDDGKAAFDALLGSDFDLEQGGNAEDGSRIAVERSPYGIDLGVAYPRPDVPRMVGSVARAARDWGRASVEERAGVCLEALARLNARTFEIAHAVMHTTGQGFAMSFQAGGPHAQDRALEAVAYAWDEQHRTPSTATWTKRVGKEETVTLEKRFRTVPRGVGVVIGCSTFPTWNGYPSIFADLATGNGVIVKPHPMATLPLALTVKVIRDVLADAGFDPDVCQLAADDPANPIAKDLCGHRGVGIIDYTGGTAFGDWIEEHCRHAVVHTEKAGVNAAIVHSTGDLRAMTGNLAFTLSLYSGQMCTTTQNVFVPRGGIETQDGHVSFEDFCAALVKAIDGLLGKPERAAEICGAIQSEATAERIERARRSGGTVLRDSAPVENAAFPDARTATPLVMQVDAGDTSVWSREVFGPIVYVVATDDVDQAIELARRSALEEGAITWACWSTDDEVLATVEEAAAEAGAALSCNLAGTIFVNQAAAFSDFHVSGANPAGNATLCDGSFVSGRFRTVQSRVPVPAAAPAAAGA